MESTRFNLAYLRVAPAYIFNRNGRVQVKREEYRKPGLRCYLLPC